jgi:hypothetical protein
LAQVKDEVPTWFRNLSGPPSSVVFECAPTYSDHPNPGRAHCPRARLDVRARGSQRFTRELNEVSGGFGLNFCFFSQERPRGTARCQAARRCNSAPVNPGTPRKEVRKREEAPEERPRSLGTRTGRGAPRLVSQNESREVGVAPPFMCGLER